MSQPRKSLFPLQNLVFRDVEMTSQNAYKYTVEFDDFLSNLKIFIEKVVVHIENIDFCGGPYRKSLLLWVSRKAGLARGHFKGEKKEKKKKRTWPASHPPRDPRARRNEILRSDPLTLTNHPIEESSKSKKIVPRW